MRGGCAPSATASIVGPNAFVSSRGDAASWDGRDGERLFSVARSVRLRVPDGRLRGKNGIQPAHGPAICGEGGRIASKHRVSSRAGRGRSCPGTGRTLPPTGEGRGVGLWPRLWPDAGPLPSHRVSRCLDRKSTRLNSSHLGISYAVFCLKKKKKTKNHETV